jgi:hypothetical protein
MLITLYLWVALSTAGVITFSLWRCGESIESIADAKEVSVGFVTVVLVFCGAFWPIFLCLLFATRPGK